MHLGTGLAVLVFMRAEVAQMLADALSLARAPKSYKQPRYTLLWTVTIATLPALLLGALFADAVDSWLRSPTVIAWASIVFGAYLWFAQRYARHGVSYRVITPGKALLIGLAQACALIPGASRSGMTMAAGLHLGLSKESASRFSFLLAIPIIFAAFVYQSWGLWQDGLDTRWLGGLAVATLTAFGCAITTMHIFLYLVSRLGYTPFVIYRVLLGLLLLVFF